jgi:hypothetical protein
MSKMAELDAMGITNLSDYVQGRLDERDDLVLALTKEMDVAVKAQDADRIKLIEDLINFLRVRQFQGDTK